MTASTGSGRSLRRAGPLAGALLACAPMAEPAQGARSEPSPRAPQRPSFVVVVADDLDTGPVVHMPTVQRLAEQGLSFRNAFATTPVCGPSRASLLTGRYAHNHGMLANRPPIGGYRKYLEGGNEGADLGSWLKAAGYRTALVGKYLNRYPAPDKRRHVPPGWDDWQALFFPEAYYNYVLNENGRIFSYAEEPAEYQTDVLSERALAFLRKTPAGTPFFLYLAPFAPHGPSEPAPRHEQLFPDLQAPRPPSFNQEDVSDRPAWVKAQPRLGPEAVRFVDDWYRRRVRALQAVDEMLAKLVAALAERGELDRTYVVFTSDNGFQLGAHRLSHGKNDPYEESIRVPLVVRGPAVPAGGSLEHMALGLDLAPTLLELAGAPSQQVDGRSLAPLLRGRPLPLEDWRKDFLIEHFDYVAARQLARGERPERPQDPDAAEPQAASDDEGGGVPEYQALRTSDQLYVEYPASGERELYDLRSDPYQLRNLHASAKPKLLKRLAERLAALRACRGQDCR